MTRNELYLKTLFCCSSCDGEIASDEISILKGIVENNGLFNDMDIETILNEYIRDINEQGKDFLKGYLNELLEIQLSDDEQIKIIELAIKMIEADNQILYSEVKFFKKIRLNLSITDERILEALPEAEDYLLPDIMTDDKETDWSNISFKSIDLSQYPTK